MKRKKYSHLVRIDTSKMNYRTWITQVDLYANSITTLKKYFSNFSSENANTLLDVNFNEYREKRNELHKNEENLSKLLSYGKTKLFQLPDFFVKMYDNSFNKIFSEHNKYVASRRNELYNSFNDYDYYDDNFDHDEFDNDF